MKKYFGIMSVCLIALVAGVIGNLYSTTEASLNDSTAQAVVIVEAADVDSDADFMTADFSVYAESAESDSLPYGTGGVASMAAAPLAFRGNRKRMAYFRNKRKHGRNKKGNTNMVVPSLLRVEQLIEDGVGQYKFDFTKPGSGADTEILLAEQDKFIIDEIGLFLIKKNSDALGTEVLQTYPNHVVFAAGTSFDPAHLEVFYNGVMSMKNKSRILLENFDLQQFRQVEGMAQSSATTYSEKSGVAGFVDLEPNVTIDGNVSNSFILDIPINSALKVGNDVAKMSNYVVLMARGFLIKE